MLTYIYVNQVLYSTLIIPTFGFLRLDLARVEVLEQNGPRHGPPARTLQSPGFVHDRDNAARRGARGVIVSPAHEMIPHVSNADPETPLLVAALGEGLHGDRDAIVDNGGTARGHDVGICLFEQFKKAFGFLQRYYIILLMDKLGL